MPHHGEPVGAAVITGLFDRMLGNEEYRGYGGTTRNPAVGWVYLAPIDVMFDLTLDRLWYEITTAIAGNVRMGLYRRNVTGWPDLPDGAALVCESGSLAQPGVTRHHFLTVPSTALIRDVYFIAFQFDNALATYRAYGTRYDHNVDGLVQPCRTFAHVYGPFPTPCPVTGANYYMPHMGMRVLSVP